MRIPKLLYGTAWKKSDTARLVELAINTGFRGMDTACQPRHYDEAGVGTGIAACLNSGLARSDLLAARIRSASPTTPALRCPPR